ncbi:MAG: AsmA family protein [Rhodospirillales bacterium]|nr:MAG: AsmA family protein [Rhodospirillales bacterium]
MKRLVLFSFSLLSLLILALLVGPSFVDWNRYKPQIVEKVKAASGYDVRIDGDLKLSLLPSPSVRVSDVSVAAPKKVKAENLLSMKYADVHVALLPLLRGEMEVASIKLMQPDIRLEVMQDGRQGWMSDRLLGAKETVPAAAQEGAAKAAGGAMEKVALDRLSIRQGRISYHDYTSGAQHLAENIDLDLSADSLKGPFEAEGKLVYQQQEIAFSADIGKIEEHENSFTLRADITLPEADAKASFSGVVEKGLEFEIQGETALQARDLSALVAFAGGKASPALAQKVSAKGMLTVNDNALSYKDASLAFGDISGQGGIEITGLKDRKPIKAKSAWNLKGILDLDRFEGARAKAPDDKESLKQAGKTAAGKKTPGLLPESLTVPALVDARHLIEMEGVAFKGKTYKGILLDIAKTGNIIQVTSKILSVPGGGKLDAKAGVSFASSSVSEKTGAVTLADPLLTFETQGNLDQLPVFLSAFVDDGPALSVWKTAQFSMEGTVTPATIKVKTGRLNLDKTSFTVGGSYTPAARSGGKPEAQVILSAGTIDIDDIRARLGGKSKAPASAAKSESGGSGAPDLKTALKPLQDFSLPVNLAFDLSASQARLNGTDIKGLRLKGKSRGTSLVLESLSIDSMLGASGSAKGQIGNLGDLSAIDLDLYGKTSDADALMKTLKVDTSKLPQKIGAAEIALGLKGSAQKLDFTSNVKALSGQLDAAGVVTGALDKPAVDNLTLGLHHPDFVRAVQIVTPSFAGGPGLQQKVDFYTKMVRKGDAYVLSGMKASLGDTTLEGALTANMAGERPAVSGDIQTGPLALDRLLATSKGKASSSSASGGGQSSAKGGRWSDNRIETAWLRSLDMDLSISARSITYGGWKFDNPRTKLTLKNGDLRVDNLNAGLFGGKAVLNSHVTAPAGQDLSLSVDSAMTNVALEPLAFAMSGSRKLKASGDVSLNMDVKSAGASPNALVNGLGGSAALDGKNVIIKGFDLARLARGLSEDEKMGHSVENLIVGTTSGGETRFDTIKGTYAIQNGIVNITSMVMDGPSSVIRSAGNVNLPRWTMDTVHEISLKGVDDLDPFKVTIKGPLDNPANTFGKSIIQDYFNRKIQRKIQKELPKLLGGDVGKKLEKFGILPQQQSPQAGEASPAQEQAPAQQQQPAADPADSWAPAQEEAPQPAQQQQQQEITPEEAIKGVLEGLLR